MQRKELMGKVAEKLKKIRHTHKYDINTMAPKLGVTTNTYRRNEKNISLPDAFSLYYLNKTLNISLDWLICDKGPIYFTEIKPGKEEEIKVEKKEPPKPYTLPPVLQELEDDLKELFDTMQQSPQLRYKVLTVFHEFKKGQN